jgi:hypothetical protein
MKHSVTVSIGAIVLSQFLASSVLADTKCYTTGPLENFVPTQTVEYLVKVLNNGDDDEVNARVVLFALNGTKTHVQTESFKVEELSSGFATLNTTGLLQYEVQVKLDDEQLQHVYLGGFGKDTNGELVAAHRLVNSEWSSLSCGRFGDT